MGGNPWSFVERNGWRVYRMQRVEAVFVVIMWELKVVIKNFDYTCYTLCKLHYNHMYALFNAHIVNTRGKHLWRVTIMSIRVINSYQFALRVLL